MKILSAPVYAGFGPTLVAEYLENKHRIEASKETVRQWMLRAELWRGKKAKLATIAPLRFTGPSRLTRTPRADQQKGTLLLCVDNALTVVEEVPAACYTNAHLWASVRDFAYVGSRRPHTLTRTAALITAVLGNAQINH